MVFVSFDVLLWAMPALLLGMFGAVRDEEPLAEQEMGGAANARLVGSGPGANRPVFQVLG